MKEDLAVRCYSMRGVNEWCAAEVSYLLLLYECIYVCSYVCISWLCSPIGYVLRMLKLYGPKKETHFRKRNIHLDSLFYAANLDTGTLIKYILQFCAEWSDERDTFLKLEHSSRCYFFDPTMKPVHSLNIYCSYVLLSYVACF